MNKLISMVENADSIAILGHIRPDGDCAGSCLGIYNYLKQEYSDKTITVFLEELPDKFSYMNGFNEICHDPSKNISHDLCICLDCGDRERLGDFVSYLDSAKMSFCADHHITNTRFCSENHIEADASSTCQVIYGFMENNKISKETAECLYTGIIHDTGVFKYSCTSAKTMEIAGKLMEKGIDYSTIIDDSFYRKTYIQNQILGKALMESEMVLDGRCIFSAVSKADMDFYNITSNDLDGIIDQLRLTKGIECAIFLYQTDVGEYKASLRSNKIVDVSAIAGMFGGGGHVRAAGCTMMGNVHDVINNLSKQICLQLEKHQTER